MRILLLSASLLASTLACTAANPVQLEKDLPVVDPVQQIKINKNDSPKKILEKAAKIRASKRQLEYHQEEFTGFIHFGINTFTGREWGNGKENVKDFKPTTVDTDQWCKVMKEAGMSKIMMTVKHHDGFCLWQTRYNDKFSVKSTSWKDGQGDVLRLLVNSAKKYDLKVGVYVSPADLYQIENKEGLYGNLSKYRNSIIPTDPKNFQKNPLKKRKVKKGLPTFTVKADDYNRYMLNQLYEVLTEYGPVHEVWFDGAHPKRKGGQKYIKEEWFKMIRQLQPGAVIFAPAGPDVRWCGNEHGGTRKTEWNIIPSDKAIPFETDRTAQDLGSDKVLTSLEYRDPYSGHRFQSNYLNYVISEVDTSIRHGWFWRNDNEQHVRGVDEMFDIYERSVGTGTVFLLNVPPNKYGKFSPRDVKCMTEVGKRIKATYGKNLVKGAKASVEKLFDNNIKTYWQAPAQKASFEVMLKKPQLINRIVLQEAISEVGQRVKKHAVDAKIDGQWQEIATATTIAYKRILRFPAVKCQQLRVRILDTRVLPAAISSFAAHYYNQPPSALKMLRAQNGDVSLSPKKGTQMQIRYTLDGSEPTAESPLYKAKLNLPKGAFLKARSFAGDLGGPVLSRRLGIARKGWKYSTNSSHKGYEIAKAFDGNPKTFWHSNWSDGSKHPHKVTIELPKTEKITGLSYLPRQDRHVPDGMIEEGYIEVSLDGKKWLKAGKFTFGNLVNSPDERFKLFDKPTKARFVRLVSTKGAAGKPYAAAAEINLLVK